MDEIGWYQNLIDELTRDARLFPDESSKLCALALLKIYSPGEVEVRELLLLQNSREEFREAIFEFRRRANKLS